MDGVRSAPLRPAVKAYAGLPLSAEVPNTESASASTENLPLVCPRCGGELTIIAFLTEADPIQRILIRIGEPATPPKIAPARAPPDWIEADFDHTVLNELENVEPVPKFDKSSG